MYHHTATNSGANFFPLDLAAYPMLNHAIIRITPPKIMFGFHSSMCETSICELKSKFVAFALKLSVLQNVLRSASKSTTYNSIFGFRNWDVLSRVFCGSGKKKTGPWIIFEPICTFCYVFVFFYTHFYITWDEVHGMTAKPEAESVTRPSVRPAEPDLPACSVSLSLYPLCFAGRAHPIVHGPFQTEPIPSSSSSFIPDVGFLAILSTM